MNRKVLLLLILCNLIWATNPLMGKILVGRFTGVQVAWIRYMGAFASFFAMAGVAVLGFGKKWSDFFLWPRELRPLLQIILVGLGPFAFSPIMQFVGLETAQSMDNSVLLATEPLLTVWMAWLVLGEKMTRNHWISMAIALIGFLLFAGFVGGGAEISFSFGLFFLIFAQLGEGMYSVLTRRLVQNHSPLAILGTGLLIGATTLTLFVFSFEQFPDLSRLGRSGLGAALWLGPLGSTLTYFIWASIARTVDVPTLAITLFIQPVVGAFLGYWVLHETLAPMQVLGALFILAGFLYLSRKELRVDAH